jgi:hypothetical protein
MQRLDAAVHHFRKSGQVADVEHIESGIAQRHPGAAGRNQFDAEARQCARQVDDAGFVRDGNEGAGGAAEVFGHGLSIFPPPLAGEGREGVCGLRACGL